ncbi:MAG TPA: alpha/beta hydrolase [Anaerolineae bacterium]|nr:alpha/beta hydrolase [Anaerolineae bacterium]
MPFVEIGNQKLFYAARGVSGAPLVFVHGAGDSHLLWNGQLGALGDVARVYAIDLPGHGRSMGEGRTTIYEYAVVVRDFLDALDISQAVIVGTSMGGAIALTCALEFAERVCGLGLIATGAKLRVAPAFLQGLQTDFDATVQILVENYYGPNAPTVLKTKSAQQLLKTGARITYQDYAACDAFDVRERLAKIQVPTLVVGATADRMTPLKYSEFLAAQIPHAQLVVIEGAGHMLMLEQPDALNVALKRWIATVSL